MKCPFCHFINSNVKDSRPSNDGASIKRKRICSNCGARFTTYERIEFNEIKVIKKDGKIKAFDSQKILRSLEIALRKRELPEEKLESTLSSIIKKIQKYGEGEVTSHVIGSLVMNELKNIDQVAYVRYASVYMDFKKAKDFIALIKEIDQHDIY